MDKYKKTAGLNYLSENSYKGDGSPGMVMGIASDARGDTNTNEAQKPTTNSKHSSERDLKKYDPTHGHTKPEGGNPQVCHLCKGEGCEPCGHTGEEITKVRNDPQVDEEVGDIGTTKRIKAMSSSDLGNIIGKQPLWVYFNRDKAEEMAMKHRDQFMDKLDHPEFMEEGRVKDVVTDAQQMSKEEFDEKYKGDWDHAEIIADYPEDELNEITRLSGIKEVRGKKINNLDDILDDEEEENPEDPDSDKVQHILMQLRKAQDVDGDHLIKFVDGTKVKLPIADINLFMDKYMDMKPADREKMQQVAIMSKEQFDTILTFFQPKHGKLEKSIYEDGQMISESQFDEAAGEKDACYHKVKSRYKVWPSAYASGALVKCRKAGASNWGEGGKKK
jgi:hypothetical protein